MLPDLKDLETWLATREAAVGGIRAGCAKQVVWADGPKKAPVTLVYIHGFSATPAEVRPLPDMVAEALGANIFFTRLTGHGQDGVAMGRARLPQWEADVEEALAIGATMGETIIVMGCSTGCTLLTTALARSATGAGVDVKDGSKLKGGSGVKDGSAVKGIVHLSPNFGLRNWFAQTLLQMPGVRKWGPLVAGRERSFDPISAEHTAYWTLKYDTQAVFTMADAVRAAIASPIESIQTPAYFAFGETDKVVSPSKTRSVMARWAGPVRVDVLEQGAEDDAMGHVMAGDVFSPQQTAPLAERIIEWAKAL